MANEKRLIDANALTDVIEHIDWYSVRNGKLTHGAVLFTGLYLATDINHALETAPTVDAVEVVHGRWIEDSDLCTITCSECGKLWCILDNDTDTFNYCPNCGAKMDGDEDGTD